MTQRDRRISAMLRVKNEEEFLRAAVESIVDLVHEIVLVENGSRDRTPAIIAALRRQHSTKIAAFEYPYKIRRVGFETSNLVSNSSGQSPHLSAVFYNWCLERCQYPYVLKWDGDMVALERLHSEIEAWRSSEDEFLCMRGANVHPNRRSFAAEKTSDATVLQRGLREPNLPEWATALSYDSIEPRLFAREGAEFRSDCGWTQRLWSPRLRWTEEGRPLARSVTRPCFLHLKLCKRNPFSNYSTDLARAIGSNVAVGPPLEPELRATLEKYGL